MPRAAESYQRGEGSGRYYCDDADGDGDAVFRPEEASGTPAERVLYHVIMMLVSLRAYSRSVLPTMVLTDKPTFGALRRCLATAR
jgi:hypothetical protein